MKLWRWVFLIVTLAVLVEGFRVALWVVPADAAQGQAGRIIYYHVPTWAAMGVMFATNLICSIVYLAVRNKNQTLAMKADSLAVSSAEVGVIFCLIGLVTGIAVGTRGVGHLVDVGRAPHQHAAAVAALCQLPDAAKLSATGRRKPWRRCSRSLRPSTCPSSTCRSSGGGRSIRRRSLAARRTRHRSLHDARVRTGTCWAGPCGASFFSLRYAAEYRNQLAEQQAGLEAIG